MHEYEKYFSIVDELATKLARERVERNVQGELNCRTARKKRTSSQFFIKCIIALILCKIQDTPVNLIVLVYAL